MKHTEMLSRGSRKGRFPVVGCAPQRQTFRIATMHPLGGERNGFSAWSGVIELRINPPGVDAARKAIGGYGTAWRPAIPTVLNNTTRQTFTMEGRNRNTCASFRSSEPLRCISRLLAVTYISGPP